MILNDKIFREIPTLDKILFKNQRNIDNYENSGKMLALKQLLIDIGFELNVIFKFEITLTTRIILIGWGWGSIVVCKQ